VVGAMLFSSMVTRSEISWTICSRRSRAMAYPTEALKAETIRCLSYLVQTRH